MDLLERKQIVKKKCNSGDIPLIHVDAFHTTKSTLVWVVTLPNQYNTWHPQVEGKASQNETVMLAGKNYESRNGFLWIDLKDLIEHAPRICPFSSECKFRTTTCRNSHTGLHFPKPVITILQQQKDLAEMAKGYFVNKYSRLFYQAGNTSSQIESFNDDNMQFYQNVKQPENNAIDVDLSARNMSTTESFNIRLDLEQSPSMSVHSSSANVNEFVLHPGQLYTAQFRCSPILPYSFAHLPLVKFIYQGNSSGTYSARFKLMVPITKFLFPSSPCSRPELENFWNHQPVVKAHKFKFSADQIEKKLQDLNIFSIVAVGTGLCASSGLNNSDLFSVVFITPDGCEVKSKDPCVTETLFGVVSGILNPCLAACGISAIDFHKIEY